MFSQQDYIGERKRTQCFFHKAGGCNEVRHLHHLHHPHIAGIYGPFNNKVIQDNTFPAISNKYLFVILHIHYWHHLKRY